MLSKFLCCYGIEGPSYFWFAHHSGCVRVGWGVRKSFITFVEMTLANCKNKIEMCSLKAKVGHFGFSSNLRLMHTIFIQHFPNILVNMGLFVTSQKLTRRQGLGRKQFMWEVWQILMGSGEDREGKAAN